MVRLLWMIHRKFVDSGNVLLDETTKNVFVPFEVGLCFTFLFHQGESACVP